MERITVSMDANLAESFDALISELGYVNRSEAIRDLLRRELETQRVKRQEAPYAVACVSYVYNHHERRLAERLTELQHQAHDLVVSSMHVHLDHEHCLETLVLRGATPEVRAFAEKLAAERGVRHGQVNLVPVETEGVDHHVHSRPRT